MSSASFIPLTQRGALRIEGEDARTFLQGLVSNDVARVSVSRAIWAAFLTPQGKYLHDLFICEHAGALLLEGEASRLPDLKRRLSMYRLRSQVRIDELGDALGVWALIGDAAAAMAGLPEAEAGAAALLGDGIVFVDPRLAAVGLRALLPAATGEETLRKRGFAAADAADYDALRIPHGLPDGSRDMLVEKSLLLECGFDELGGIDWDKGCYLGQELTARTRWRGLVKRRLLPTRVQGPAPAPGSSILLEGKEVGEVRSSVDGWAIALLRLDALAPIREAGGVKVGEATLLPQPPAWAVLPADVLAGDDRT